MNTHSDKTTETKSNAVANDMAVQQGAEHETFQLKDDRPETITQRKIQEAANDSPQANQLKAVQAMANNSRQVKQLRAVQAMANGNTTQLKEINEEETVQHKSAPEQKKENKTGLPDNLKSGVEDLSGYSLDDVKVHYNSDKPAQLNALAYAQGTDIHVANGQENHLPHEAWHVVQQKQGRVEPTMQMKEGVSINDDQALEQEADSMGAKALQFTTVNELRSYDTLKNPSIAGAPVQRLVGFEIETRSVLTPGPNETALQKDKVLLTKAGWTLTVEIQGAEKVVEFKVRAVDDKSDPDTLKATLDDLAVFAAAMGGHAGGTITIEDIALATGATVSDAKFKKTTITPEAAIITGMPQMTAGISLDTIINLLQDMTVAGSQLMKGAAGTEATKPYRDKMKGTIDLLDLFDDMDKFPKSYKGFIALLSSYIHSTTNAPGRLTYFKAGVPALSRADLGLYMEMPEIAKRKAQILKDVLFYADVKGGDKMIPTGTYNDRKEAIEVPLTIEDWIKSIIAGVDTVPWSLQVNQENKAFGAEPVGPKEGIARAVGLPIEIRSLKTNIPHNTWSPYLVHLFKYVKALNSDDPKAYTNI
jgi:hypothetical protein